MNAVTECRRRGRARQDDRVVDTEIAEPANEQRALTPPPETGRSAPTWLRRTIIGVVLIAAFGLAAWGATSATSGGNGEILDGTVVALSPPEGAQALRQTAVGADLALGYDGRLIVNGIEIPEAEMDGARDPATVDAKDLAENGLRPNNRNSVYFKPGPGKVIEKFEQGTVTITLRYFKDRRPETARTVTWTIRVD